jgi:glycine/sarcosine N-methyltransferase
VNLSKGGFTVTSSDGSASMVSKDRENAAKFGLAGTRLMEAQWTSLSEVFHDENFDTIVCLGNAFTHLFNHDERRQVLDEIYGLLNNGGVAV